MFSFGGPSPFDTDLPDDDNPFGVSIISTTPTIFNTTPITDKQQIEINTITRGRKYEQINDVPYDFTLVLCDTVDTEQQNIILELPVHYNVVKHYLPSICNETSESMTREDRVLLPLDVLENEVTPTSLQKLVDFIYNHQVPVPEIHEVVSMLTLSDFLVFDALRDECIKILVPKVTQQNAIQMLGWSSGLHTNWNELRNAAQSVIISKFAAVVDAANEENAAGLFTVRIDTIAHILKTALVAKFFHYYRFKFLSLWMRQRYEVDVQESRFSIIAEYLRIKKDEKMEEREFTTPLNTSGLNVDLSIMIESDLEHWSYFIEEIILTEACINFNKYREEILQVEEAVVKQILLSDYLGVDSEDQVVQFVLEYKKHTPELLKECVRWALVTPDSLTKMSNDPNFNIEEIFGSTFAEAVKTKAETVEDLPEKFTRVRRFSREKFGPEDQERPKITVSKQTGAEMVKLLNN
jgi:hypothetical protein